MVAKPGVIVMATLSRRDRQATRAPDTQDEEIVDSNDSSGGLVVLAVDDEEPALEELAYLLSEDKRVELKEYGSGFYRVKLRYGFMEEIDVPAALGQLEGCGPTCKMMDTSFFLARQTLLASSRPGMAIWRERLFAWMLRNAESAMEFFKLPTNRVVELGSQVEI